MATIHEEIIGDCVTRLACLADCNDFDGITAAHTAGRLDEAASRMGASSYRIAEQSIVAHAVAQQIANVAVRAELEQRIFAATMRAQDALVAFMAGLGPGYRFEPQEQEVANE